MRARKIVLNMSSDGQNLLNKDLKIKVKGILNSIK